MVAGHSEVRIFPAQPISLISQGSRLDRAKCPPFAGLLALSQFSRIPASVSVGRQPREFSRLDNRYSRFPENLAGDSGATDMSASDVRGLPRLSEDRFNTRAARQDVPGIATGARVGSPAWLYCSCSQRKTKAAASATLLLLNLFARTCLTFWRLARKNGLRATPSPL